MGTAIEAATIKLLRCYLPAGHDGIPQRVAGVLTAV